ncbi:DEAD/DEAH box helicase [Candidatus Woesearchaeota archaeon]|jgi:ERCC4-related helicase|nr:DEAD/DEAH box helicase [Candidatus Woesearchaeota archaeon]MBT6023096.1 DEAD/DEAH box helicase [Candidatus Woesearchaeota archaeon]
MLFLKNKLKLRNYQEQILGKIVGKNSFVVLPTGAGKTIIAIALAALNIDKGKILIMAPTKPLTVQHEKSFKEYFQPEEKIIHLTGAIPPIRRKELWKTSKIICATPQTIESDLIKRYFKPEDISLVVFDEAHRAVGEYAYVWLAKQFGKTSQILALSASPASDKERLELIKENLKIDNFELLSEENPQLKKYLKEKKIERVMIDLPEEYKKIKAFLQKLLRKHVTILHSRQALKSKEIEDLRKLELLKAQRALFAQTEKGPETYFIVSELTVLIKLLHLIETLETQSLKTFIAAMDKIEKDSKSTKASKKILDDWDFKRARISAQNIVEEGIEHPKIGKILELTKKDDEKIIIFSQLRKTVEIITEQINLNTRSRAKAFVGQKEGMTQKKQIETLEKFKDGEFNVLVATSVSEEGLHIENADIGIFFEPVPSALRTIQRRGRIGRINIGKVYMLITRDTIDEKYYWVSYHKERRMKELLENES